jgi:hypothetical protein
MGIRIRSCLAAALLAGGGPVTAAYGQRALPQDVQRGVTVESRPRPDFDPLACGWAPSGSTASWTPASATTANVFGRRRNVESDGYATETANVSVGSEWSRHAVGASATIDSRQYFNQTGLNWTDWNLGGFGRTTLTPEPTSRRATATTAKHLDVFNYDVQRAGIAQAVPNTDVRSAGIFQPVPYDSDEVQVTGTTRFNRLGLTGIGLYRTFRFEDTDLNGVRNRNSLNNFDTAIGAVAASYASCPAASSTAAVRLQDISYNRGRFPGA